jgi:hypothetical protein
VTVSKINLEGGENSEEDCYPRSYSWGFDVDNEYGFELAFRDSFSFGKH